MDIREFIQETWSDKEEMFEFLYHRLYPSVSEALLISICAEELDAANITELE